MLDQDLPREDVYAALDSELDYQQARWGDTQTGGRHNATEFTLYMQDYLTEAMRILSRNAEPDASEQALHVIRKVTALGVSCMRQNGAPHR